MQGTRVGEWKERGMICVNGKKCPTLFLYLPHAQGKVGMGWDSQGTNTRKANTNTTIGEVHIVNHRFTKREIICTTDQQAKLA